MFQKAKVHQKGLVNKNTKKLKVKLPAGFVCARPDCLEDKRFTFWIHFLDSLFVDAVDRRGAATLHHHPPLLRPRGPSHGRTRSPGNASPRIRAIGRHRPPPIDGPSYTALHWGKH
eukprot:GHVT01029912.1.p1 GENE.GHVT01029912.1~~GHVT01029912.1.p1  ORF type:complete len:116 (-),score=14.51 GHVT01029912.1:958-1305(-)